jgi:hypothetical protein
LTFDVTMFVYYGAKAPVFSRIWFPDIYVGDRKRLLKVALAQRKGIHSYIWSV